MQLGSYLPRQADEAVWHESSGFFPSRLPGFRPLIGPPGLWDDLSGPWLDLAAIERLRGSRCPPVLRLEWFLEQKALFTDGDGCYFWEDSLGVHLLEVKREPWWRRLFNWLTGGDPLSCYRVRRVEFRRK